MWGSIERTNRGISKGIHRNICLKSGRGRVLLRVVRLARCTGGGLASTKSIYHLWENAELGPLAFDERRVRSLLSCNIFRCG